MTDSRQATEARPNILAIDDTPENLLTLQEALGSEFDLRFATSGAMGLALAAEAPPDLILLDVMMPQMDGFATCRRLKADSRLRSIPVIFVTALADSDAEGAGLELGAADYITKPICVEIARKRIRNLLERERLRKEVEDHRDHLEELVQALNKSEARHRAVIQTAYDAIITSGSDGSILGWNHGAETIFGYAESEIMGKPMALLVPERFREGHLAGINRIRTGGAHRGIGKPVELSGLRKDGSELPLELSLAKWECADGWFVTAIIRDITERKRAEEARAMLSAIVDSSNDAIISRTLDGTVLTWNAGAQKMFGYSAAEMISKSANLIVPSEHHSIMSKIDAALIRGEVVHGESRRITKDERVLDVLGSHSPIKDVAGNVVAVSTIIQDITERKANKAEMSKLMLEIKSDIIERKKAENALRESNARLELLVGYEKIYENRKFASLGVMAGGIAHEVRNPLAVSFSAAQFLLEGSCDPVFQRECAQKIIVGIQQASTIIENLLRFARPSTDRQMRRLDLVELVRESLGMLAPQAKAQNIAVIEVYDDPSLPISGKQSQLQQVIVNLMQNAFQAMKNGGTIRTVVLRDAVAAEAVVRVSDTGCGIPSAELDHVFDPFFTTKLAEKGTGLGLSICHTILKQHGGSISVESVEGVSSTFTVRLPL